MTENVEHLLNLISNENSFQTRYIQKVRTEIMTAREFQKLDFLVDYLRSEGFSLEEQAKSYLTLCEITMEEQLHFRRNHCDSYRAKNYAEVCQAIYNNDEYMNLYMTGLTISDFIWSNHIHVLRWYEDKLKNDLPDTVDTYLEIGCGRGFHFLHVMQAINARQYIACDLSAKSVAMCKDLLSYAESHSLLSNKRYAVEQGDFFDFTPENKADVFTMFEVLEHVFNPGEMLDRIHDVTTDYAQIFVSTAINSPQPDHVYLFRNVEEVLTMVKEHGFLVEDMICAASNGENIDEAERKKQPITIALKLSRNL